MFEKATSRGDGFSASAYFNLARSKQQEGKLQEAEELYWQGHRSGHLISTYNLANMIMRRGNYAEAEILYRDVIRREPIVSLIPSCWEDDEHVSNAMNNLGSLLDKQGKRDEALRMWVRAAKRGNEDSLLNLLLFARKSVEPRGASAVEDVVPKLLSQFLQSPSATKSVETFVEALKSLKSPEELSFSKGCHVILYGLETDAGKALNGCRGVVLGKDTKTGRLAVQVDGVGRRLRKRANLAWSPFPPEASSRSSPQIDDLGAALEESSRQADERAADDNAPLMEALLHSRQPENHVGIVVLEYSRNEAWFRKALATAPELAERRQAIEDAGYQVELSCGAKCLVPANIFKLVEEDLQRRGVTLSKRHVVVDAALEAVVAKVINDHSEALTRRERGSFKLKGRSSMEVDMEPPSTPSSSGSEKLPVKRTFIQVQIPSSMYSLSSEHPHTA